MFKMWIAKGDEMTHAEILDKIATVQSLMLSYSLSGNEDRSAMDKLEKYEGELFDELEVEP